MVRNAFKASVARPLALGACTIALASCGSSPRPPAYNLDQAMSGELQVLNCADWRFAAPATRATIIRQLHGFYGAPVASNGTVQGRGSVLSNAQAARLFDSYCAQRFARGFTLYKLYARAAGLSGQAP